MAVKNKLNTNQIEYIEYVYIVDFVVVFVTTTGI